MCNKDYISQRINMIREREFRKLSISDLELVLQMKTILEVALSLKKMQGNFFQI